MTVTPPDRDERMRRVGLCATCAHTERVVSSRGSEFWLCRRSRTEPARFRKYPPLPVVACAGFEVHPPGG